MFRKRHYEQEKNPWKMVIYILLVLALLACLVFLVKKSRERRASYQDQVKQLAALETEFHMEETEQVETESETETETESETESETETETENKEVSVLILNGTRKEGVAGYWKKQLEKDGYTNVSTASYREDPEDRTVIYAEEISMIQPFLKYFENGVFRKEGIVESSIEASENLDALEKYDICMVIGRNDARNE